MTAVGEVRSGQDRASSAPAVAGVVVHWKNEVELARLIEAWPLGEHSPLVVVDNSGTAEPPAPAPGLHWIRPDDNLGFGGGCNAGVETTDAPWVLLLNPDAAIGAQQLRALTERAATWGTDDPRLALIAPRLVNGRGEADQFGWQLKPLPRPRDLIAQCFFLSRPRGPRHEPAEGARVDQPAAAALLVRRAAFNEVDGFDSCFAPAWFEDVDLAQRLHDAGWHGRYARSVEVRHDGGASVSPLGFGRFLVIYTRNLHRYARARNWTWTARSVRPAVIVATILRIPTLLLRRPRAAASRSDALRSLVMLLRAALRGWPEATP